MQHIRGSPFEIVVEPGPSALRSIVSGDALRSITAGDTGHAHVQCGHVRRPFPLAPSGELIRAVPT
jgi:hypothetical protein